MEDGVFGVAPRRKAVINALLEYRILGFTGNLYGMLVRRGFVVGSFCLDG